MQSPPLFRNLRWSKGSSCSEHRSRMLINNQIGGPRMGRAPYLVELGSDYSSLRYLNERLRAVGERRSFPIWMPLSRFSLVVKFFAPGLAFARYLFPISPSIRNVLKRLPAFESRSSGPCSSKVMIAPQPFSQNLQLL